MTLGLCHGNASKVKFEIFDATISQKKLDEKKARENPK
jgi:hypothetical protein